MPSNEPQLVLVTGASGFLGSHIIDQLVREGSGVRGTARSAKVLKVREAYDAAYGAGRVEIVCVDDLAGYDFTSVLKGVTAVIHTASPLIGREAPESTFHVTVGGTVNLVRQALVAGVKRFSIASTSATALNPANPGVIVTETDWNPSTKELVLKEPRNDAYIYATAKTLAEKAIWAIAEEHPDINVTTLNPTLFIGPHAPGHLVNTGDMNALSTNLVLYNILVPDSKVTTPFFGCVDVRDVARGLIAGIKTPGKNRVLLTGEWFEFKESVDYIASIRPELKDRLANITPTGQTQGIIDNSRAQEVLGIPFVRPWKESVIEAIDTFIQLERDWASRGIDLQDAIKGRRTVRVDPWDGVLRMLRMALGRVYEFLFPQPGPLGLPKSRKA